MKKKILSFAVIPIILLLSHTGYAQTWDGSSVSTTTSTAGGTLIPMVGIGTNTPNHELDVNHVTDIANNAGLKPAVVIHDDIYTGTTDSDPIHDSYNTFEIKSTRTYDFFPPQLPNPLKVSKLNFFVNTNYNSTKVGIGKPNANSTLDVGGDINADWRVTAPIGQITDYLSVENYITVNNGSVVLSHPLDYDRNIEAHTSTGALNLLAGNGGEDAGIRLFGRNNSGFPGGTQHLSNGTNASETAHLFMTYAGSNTWNDLLSIYKDGKIKINNLNGSGPRMVVADANGVLSTTSLPSSGATYRLSRSGHNIQLEENGIVVDAEVDGLGNHTASMTLNMNSKDIDNIKQAFIDDALVFSSSQGIIKGMGTNGVQILNSLGVNGLITGSEKFLVSGDGKVTGQFTCSTLIQTSDRRLKENIVSLENSDDVISRLKKVVPYQYNFTDKNLSATSLWKFDDNVHYGFMAQDIQEIFPQLVSPIDDEGHLGLNYIEFIPMLLQAIKEEDQQIQEQQATINQLNEKVNSLNSESENVAALQNKVATLEEKLASLSNTAELVNAQQKTIAQLQEKLANMENDINICCQAKSTHTSDIKAPVIKSSLDQNVPNPFNGETKIGFNIVEKYTTAFIGFYDLNGRTIMQIPVEQGSNYVIFTNNNMQPGMYVYSLVVDNQLIDSKKMIVAE